MWTLLLFLSSCSIVISAGRSTRPSFEGCYSTKVVQQYAFYYTVNHSLPLEECFSLCNTRLTTQIGLQVDKSAPAYTFVYCGNDLLEVSPKVHLGQCQPCEENNATICGRYDNMAVYLLRETTPSALLLATDKGVEMLVDNSTTLRVAHTNYSSNKYVDYIYTDDAIISAIGTKILRSFYNTLTMKFSEHYVVLSNSYSCTGFAVDYNQSIAYFGYYGNYYLYAFNLITKANKIVYSSSNLLTNISIDPFNRSAVFIKSPFDAVYVYLLVPNKVTSYNIIHLDKIKTLAMNIEEKLLYAIVTLKGDSTTYLVSMDYSLTQRRVLYKGPQLTDATGLEVYKGEAVWLVISGNTSYIYTCKLTPRCNPEHILVYQTNQYIYDFKIYHPEKQTPGENFLCKLKSCSHGCKAFTPFSSRCVCPPGMRLNPDNATCYELASTPSPTTTPDLSTSPTETSSEDWNATWLNLTSPNFTRTLFVEPPEDKDSESEPTDSGQLMFEAFLKISNLIVLTLLVGIGCVVVDLYRKQAVLTRHVQEELHQMKNLDNEYVDRLILA